MKRRIMKRTPPSPIAGSGARPLIRRPLERVSTEGYFGSYRDPALERRLKEQERERRELGQETSGSSINPVDMRGKADWVTVHQRDTGEASWGVIHIDANVEDGAAMVDPVTDAAHVEVLVLGYIQGGSSYVLFEGAVGTNLGLPRTLSAGPVVLQLSEGEVPDRIEVLARARHGGSAQATVRADETLLLMVGTRWHR
jgi:hypothetical protein